MHRDLDRFGPHGGIIPYSCMDAITVLRKSLKDVAGYKNVGLTKRLRLLVLRLELCSALLTVSLFVGLVRCVVGILTPLLVFSERVRVRVQGSFCF